MAGAGTGIVGLETIAVCGLIKGGNGAGDGGVGARDGGRDIGGGGAGERFGASEGIPEIGRVVGGGGGPDKDGLERSRALAASWLPRS